MADRWLILIGFIVGLGPTFGLLWTVMSRFEKKIAERDTNASFVLGIFAGLLVIIAHLYFIVTYSASFMGLMGAFGLGLAESLLYYIYLNRRKFRKRTDKPFIGAAFALGAASMYIAFLMGHLTTNVSGWNISHILGLFIFASGAATVRGAVGILMARTSSRKLLLKNSAMGMGILGVFNLISIFYLNPVDPFLWTLSIPGVLYGIAAWWYFMKDFHTVEKHVVKE